MLIIVKCCGDYCAAMVIGFILNHFLLLQNVVQKDNCAIKLYFSMTV